MPVSSPQVLEDNWPLPDVVPQMSRRTTRLQHATRSVRPDLEMGGQNLKRKRRHSESRERNDGTNKLGKTFCQEGATCDCAKAAMLQEKMINNLMNRVSVLEQMIRMIDPSKGVHRSQHSGWPEQAVPQGKYVCPIENCRKPFKRSDNLSRHILDSRNSEHKEIARNLNQRYCVPCQKSFNRPSDFTRHEKNNHEELYKARLRWFENAPVDGTVKRMSTGSPLPASTQSLKPTESVSNHLQSLTNDKSSDSTETSKQEKSGCSANSLEPLPGDIYGSKIDPLSSSVGGENNLETRYRTLRPDTSFNDSVRVDDNKNIRAADTCASGDHILASDDIHNTPASIEALPFLPQRFFDAAPYDLQTSSNDGFTPFPESIDNESQSPFLPASFFDAGPYDLQPETEEGFVSYTETIHAPADGSVSQQCFLDARPCDI